jgi:hypothetical protein
MLCLGSLLGPAYSSDDLTAKIAAAGDAAKHNADAVIVLSHTDVRVRPSGIGTARSHVVTKVLRDAAIRSQAVQVFPFDPHTNRLELVAVRVYRKDGGVEDVALDTKVEQAQPSWGVYWGTRQYLVSVPRLSVGDAVETISEMTGFNVAYLAAGEASGGSDEVQLNAYGRPLEPPVAGNWHDEVQFWSNLPIIEKRYTVRAPRDKPIQYEVYGGELRTAMMLDGDELVYTFEKKDIVPFKEEPAMEPPPNVATKLLLATLPTWEDKSRWLYAVSEPHFESDDAIRRTVAAVIRNCKTDEEKYTALNHWVAENIRYAGTSRGMCEGYTIHDIKETFHDRAGVCKDKAGMLVGMLRVAGFESFLVMTMARQRVDRVPADQFNHAVTCLRKPDGTLVLLDPTWMPKSRDNWSTLEPLQHVVYGLPEGKELSQSPDFPPEDNLVDYQATSRLSADGRVETVLSFSATGAPETRLRRGLANYSPAERGRLLDETLLRVSPNARWLESRAMEPADYSGPVTLTGKFAADTFVVGTNENRLLRLPLLQTPLGDRVLVDLLDKTGPKERKYGLRLWASRLAKFDETLELPPGWEVTKKPDDVNLDGPSAALQFRCTAEGGKLHYTCELKIKRWIIPPNEYANFKEVMDKFTELTGRVVACKAEGSHASR